MTLNRYAILISLAIMSLSACEKEKTGEPQCPECWDSDMLCIDLQCECPEGMIVNWFEAILLGDEEGAPPKKFCIEPSPYTFIAEFEAVGCLDTFAIVFPWEPTTEIDSSAVPNGPSQSFELEIERPTGNARLPYDLFYNEFDELEMIMSGMPANTNGVQIRAGACSEYDENGDQIGYAKPWFQGVFVHPDTIWGQLTYLANGTLAHLNDVEVPLDLIRTVPSD